MSTLGRPAVAAAPAHAPHRSDEGPGFAGLALALPASVRWKALVLCAALAFSGEAMSQRGDILDCQEFANEIPSLIRDGCWIKDEEHKPACENAYRQATSEILSWCNGNVRRCDEQRRAVLDREGMAYPFNVTWGLHGWSPSMGGPRWNVKCFHAAVYPKAGSASPNSQQPREASQPEVRKKPTRSTVRQVQADLARLGYKPGPADGIAGRRTAAAVKRFQSDSGLPADGRITAALVAMLQAAVDAGKGTSTQPRPEKAQAASRETPAAAPSGKAGDLWGSIAYSPTSRLGVIVWNSGGRGAAKEQSLQGCRRDGGIGCKEVAWFQNACGAIAIGSGTGYGGGWGESKAESERMALSNCRSAASNCKVEVSRCTDTAAKIAGVAKAPAKNEPEVVAAPKCVDIAKRNKETPPFSQCWGEFDNKPGCYAYGFLGNEPANSIRGLSFNSVYRHLWSDDGSDDGSMELLWSGRCIRGVATGRGTISMINSRSGDPKYGGCGSTLVATWNTLEGKMEHGRMTGSWVRGYRVCESFSGDSWHRERVDELRRNRECIDFDDQSPAQFDWGTWETKPC